MIAAAVGVLALCCCRAPAAEPRGPATLAQVRAMPLPGTRDADNKKGTKRGTKKWARETGAAFKEQLGKAREFEMAALREREERDQLLRDGFQVDGPVLMLGSSLAATVDFPATAPAFLVQEVPVPSLAPRERPNTDLHDLNNR